MQQIADWLKSLGMSEYAQRFAENGITVAARRHLTDQDLKDIGVLLGHRRIVLAAITSLNDTPTVASPAQVAVPAPQSARACRAHRHRHWASSGRCSGRD